MATVEINGLILDVSPNSRHHWATKARKVKAQRKTVAWMLKLFGGVPPAPPLVVVLTRIGPRKLDDDNVTGTLKYTRDSVAEWLGLDDGDDRLTWKCQQEKGSYAVRIELFTPKD